VALYVGGDRVDLGTSDIEEVLCVRHFVCDENVVLQVGCKDGDRDQVDGCEDRRDALES
jgi:hypothetical protein